MLLEKSHLVETACFGINFQSGGSNRIIDRELNVLSSLKKSITGCGFQVAFYFLCI